MNTGEKQERKPGTFLPGVSGNPNGRPPKGYSITEAFRSMLSEKPEVKQKIVDAIRERAEKGDPTAQKLIWNYMDGMPQQSPDDPGTPDNPIHMKVTFVKP